MSLSAINRIAETVPAELLPEIFKLNMETGALTWRKRPADHFPDGKPTPELRAKMWNGKYAGKPALTTRDPRGYAFGAISGKNVYAHRVICALIYGSWPDGEVDHINRDKTDNRPKNLRVVSHRENRLNTLDVQLAAERRAEKRARKIAEKQKHPASGIRRQGKTTWCARIKSGGKETYLGAFKCFGQAVKARRAAL